MAVDKSYGSGKSRSAANSRARQRAAAGQMTKGKKGTSATLRKIAAENPVTGFIGGGVIPAKLLKAASALRAAGQVGKAAAVEARLGAKTIGRNIPKNYSIFPKGLASGPKTVEGKLRSASESVYPRLTERPGAPIDASKMIRPRKPKPSTKALRDYRSTGRPPSKPGSMEGWQGIQYSRKGNR